MGLRLPGSWVRSLALKGAAVWASISSKPLTVRSCVLIKLRPKKLFSPTASYGHSVTRAYQDLGAFFLFGAPLAFFSSGSEALLTRCPYEAEGKTFFWPELKQDIGADCLNPVH